MSRSTHNLSLSFFLTSQVVPRRNVLTANTEWSGRLMTTVVRSASANLTVRFSLFAHITVKACLSVCIHYCQSLFVGKPYGVRHFVCTHYCQCLSFCLHTLLSESVCTLYCQSLPVCLPANNIAVYWSIKMGLPIGSNSPLLSVTM